VIEANPEKCPAVIIHTDDLGLSLGFNEGILESACQGLLTSTSIRVNGTAYKDAVERIVPRIGHVAVGLHLNIVEGRSTRFSIGPREHLCQPNGNYRLGFGSLWRLRNNKQLLHEIELDFRDQIERSMRDLRHIDHLNSHQHSHAIPRIFDLTCRLAVEYKIRAVRLPREPFYWAGPAWRHFRSWYALNVLKWGCLNWMARSNKKTADRWGISTPDAFIGILYTGHMTADTILDGVRRASSRGYSIEVLLHPAKTLGRTDEVFINASVRNYVINPERRRELNTLIDPRLASAVQERKWRLCTMTGVVHRSEGPASERMVIDRPLRAMVVFDETPYYQPAYLQRLLSECPDVQVAAAAIVKLPHGGKLQKYLLANWRELGVVQVLKLGLKTWRLRLIDFLPRSIRGNSAGSSHRVARDHCIPYQVVDRVNTAEFKSWVKELDLDLIISSNSCIFDEELINLPKVACINRHSALLPSLGGILPVFRAIQFGHSHTGVSVHYMVREIDAGRVLSRKAVPIYSGDTLDTLYKLCFVMSFEATAEAIAKLRADSRANPLDNTGIVPSYFSFPNATDWAQFRQRRIPFI
jgi:methionyl-tRNA formyltransferase